MAPPKDIDFRKFPDREVRYMDFPYPKSKLLGKVWYFKSASGEYRPFTFQHLVRYRTDGSESIDARA